MSNQTHVLARGNLRNLCRIREILGAGKIGVVGERVQNAVGRGRERDLENALGALSALAHAGSTNGKARLKKLYLYSNY